MKFWGLGSEDEVRLVMFRFSQLKLKSCLTKFTSGVLTITCMSCARCGAILYLPHWVGSDVCPVSFGSPVAAIEPLWDL